jgi:heme/copper-type cytochrome/quinol oxidase subunit 2
MAGKNISVLTPMISLTASLANFGYLLAAFIVPGRSPIAGYLLGSLFIGVIYVLPVSAVALFYRSAKTKRQPSLRTLTPLAIIWAISLALILLSSSVGTLQTLVATLQILLMLTTMLLFPLIIAFRMAKLAA